MNTRMIIAAALLGGLSLAGGFAATAASDTGAAKRAAAEYRTASKALGKHKVTKAIAAAESAVSLDPRNAGYRTLLGQAYLAAGRFPSAVGALSDALSLDPANGTAALHLALAQIATGDWGGARETIGAHEGTIPASDRGLALALAGDPVTAVAVLTEAARTPGADAKTRQNLALSLALAGRWNEAKTVAALDMAPAEVDARIMQWASFAKPTGAADQVAALLGVVPIVDGGQPERLALNVTTPNVAAVAQTVAPVDTFMPGQVAAAAAPTPVEVAPSVGTVDIANIASGIRFAERREIVQAIPVAAPRLAVGTVPRVRQPVTAQAAATPATVAVRPLAKGNFFVQLGAFENAGVARDAWRRLSGRVGTLVNYAPQGVSIRARGQNFYRLSVGGFARSDADGLCRKVRSGGGACFVRTGAGDQMAAWAPRGVQVASR
ncbi:MAG: tetratricopeptide repeat protein [Pseudomonadota bacterium]